MKIIKCVDFQINESVSEVCKDAIIISLHCGKIETTDMDKISEL